MNAIQAIPLVILASMLSACGGSSGNPVTDLVDGSEDRCENSYYQALQGRYEGTIYFSTQNRQCEWETAMTVFPSSRILGCELSITVESTVTQLTVYDADDPNVYQCVATNATYRLIEPNDDLTSDALYDSIAFPIDVRVEDDPLGSSSGPYFGNSDVQVSYNRLFDGAGVIDSLIYQSESSLSVVGGTPGFVTVEGTLLEE